MNPTFLDSLSWEIAEVYGAITDQILINLSRYFKYYKPGDKLPRTAFEYQAGMLAQMGKVNRDTIRIIRNGLDGADEALQSTLEQAIIDSVRKSQPELLKGVKAGILAPQGVPIVAPNQMRAFKLYYQQSADKLNLVNTVMLESTKSAYQQTVSDVIADIELADRMGATAEALDVAAGETVTGVSSWNTALRHATDRLKNRGIVGFVDHAGRQWSAEAYVAMDVRTTTFNIGRASVWEQNQDFGNDLYLVSYHNGARPLCYDWQNKVISSLNVSRDVVDLDGNKIHVYAQSDTTYGQPAGLFGINCKHYPSPFIPGVSIVDGQPQSPEENEKTYKESQEQRRLERKLREEKRDYLMAKEQGASPEELAALRNKSRKTSQEIDDFCEQTGRARHRDREAVYTKREFPDKKKYDVKAFEHEQQNAINEYFTNGGAQQSFTAGQMTPNEPITPKPPAPVAPVAPVAPMVTPQNVASQATQTTPQTVQYQAGNSVQSASDFKLLKQHMKDAYGIDVTSGVGKMDFDLVKQSLTGFESVAADFPDVAKSINQIKVGGGGVMSCDGEKITFRSLYFDTTNNPNTLANAIVYNVKSGFWVKNSSAGSIGAHETAHGVEMVLIETSGKYATQASKVSAWNNCTEARSVVHDAFNAIANEPFAQGKTIVDLEKEISTYAYKGGASETMAEAFADVYANGQNAHPFSIAIRKATEARYKQYKGVLP